MKSPLQRVNLRGGDYFDITFLCIRCFKIWFFAHLFVPLSPK
jgi:hypothetical protein